MRMILTKEQQALLDGEKGATMAKVVKTLVMYGEAFGAERMVPVTSRYGHTVISFGIGVMKPVYELYDELLRAGAKSKQPFSADPRPLDKNVPSSFLQNVVFKFMYSQQEHYEEQLRQLGLMGEDAYTCACYLPEAGNVPQRGEVLSWAESSAVVYANSVLGARCNRNSGIIELMGSIAGFVPEFGLLTDDGRPRRLGGGCAHVEAAGRAAARLGRGHEGSRKSAVRARAGQVARQGARRPRVRVFERFRRGVRVEPARWGCTTSRA